MNRLRSSRTRGHQRGPLFFGAGAYSRSGGKMCGSAAAISAKHQARGTVLTGCDHLFESGLEADNAQVVAHEIVAAPSTP